LPSVANIVDDPEAFFVPPDSPHRTVADLLAYARANPERVAYGTTGIGSDDHLATLAFERLAGVRLTHVPVAGAAQVRNAIPGRQITLASMTVGEGIADVRQRSSVLPARWARTPLG
jgi:tripartite-type tricarboxylate transporter receptor subunit TctC